MIRRIIEIDANKCNGCGICVTSCHEGAIQMVDGIATLTRDDYCDGLGDCLPTCPTNAISFIEREAKAYDEEAVKANMKKQSTSSCPGSRAQSLQTKTMTNATFVQKDMPSMLEQWPVQIQLAPINAPYFENANILIAADCSAFAYASFHQKFMKNKVTLIGCPKLDPVDYSEKLTAILSQNNIRSITIVRMEVPCCGGLEYAVEEALKNSQKQIPWSIHIVSIDGELLEY